MVVRPDTYNPPKMPTLTVSIALVFTIGKPTSPTPPTTRTSVATMIITTTSIMTTTHATIALTTSDNRNQTNPLIEPCDCGCPSISPEITPRIVNGEAAVPNSWPWQLLLIVFTSTGLPSSYCGASLITPKHVLTAAHCVFGRSPRYIGVFTGLHVFNISSWSISTAYMAERIYVHEAYDDIFLNNDVAVIRLLAAVPLNDQVSLSCIAPANLNTQELVEGEPLVATGWGALESYNRSRPSVLQQVRLQYVPQTHPACEPLVGIGENVRPGIMCAGFPPRAICFGDSVGPLVRSIIHSNGKTYWQQVGIMSGTVDCGHETNFSDIYARVNYYNPWIVDKIRISA